MGGGTAPGQRQLGEGQGQEGSQGSTEGPGQPSCPPSPGPRPVKPAPCWEVSLRTGGGMSLRSPGLLAQMGWGFLSKPPGQPPIYLALAGADADVAVSVLSVERVCEEP